MQPVIACLTDAILVQNQYSTTLHDLMTAKNIEVPLLISAALQQPP